MQRPTTPQPALSVILSTPGGFSAIRKTLAHLAGQTARDSLELVIVASSLDVLQPDAGVLAAFPRHRIVEVAEFRSLGDANAAGVRAASAPLVVLAEDHCFPDPEWAEQLIKAHEGPWVAVGPAVRNANPSTAASWADLFIGYGPWLEPIQAQDVPFLPGHNSSYKRAVLLAFGDRLPELLSVETVLHWELRSQGHRLRLEPKARVAHTNFSLWSSWLPVLWLNGRAFAGERRKGMNVAARALYALASPLIPFVRLARIVPTARSTQLRLQFLRSLPALMFGLGVDALGQMAGYAFGAAVGDDRLAKYECHRVQHVTARDRREVFAE
ncbi:MAG TPA: glycosyltransferase [Gemmatimonadaceae bacterium]|nr:glycosyltransferase [Gemmatimonadaceae bacterium]